MIDHSLAILVLLIGYSLANIGVGMLVDPNIILDSTHIPIRQFHLLNLLSLQTLLVFCLFILLLSLLSPSDSTHPYLT